MPFELFDWVRPTNFIQISTYTHMAREREKNYRTHRENRIKNAPTRQANKILNLKQNIHWKIMLNMQTAEHLYTPRGEEKKLSSEHTTHCMYDIAIAWRMILFFWLSVVLFALRIIFFDVACLFWQIFWCCCFFSRNFDVEKCTFLFRFVSVWGFSCFLLNVAHICFAIHSVDFCIRRDAHCGMRFASIRLSFLIIVLKWDNDDNNGLTWQNTNRLKIWHFI